MDLRPALQLKSAIRALTDVVLPAIDPGNKLAQEQARLTIGMLHLALQRLPLAFRYDLDELSRLLDLAAALSDHAGAHPQAQEIARELAPLIAQGKAVRARALADPAELQASSLALRERIGPLVTALTQDRSGPDLKPVSTLVMEHAKAQLLRDRAWLAPQGWEPAGSLPDIETLLPAAPGAAT
jgi:hypothetical protein